MIATGKAVRSLQVAMITTILVVLAWWWSVVFRQSPTAFFYTFAATFIPVTSLAVFMSVRRITWGWRTIVLGVAIGYVVALIVFHLSALALPSGNDRILGALPSNEREWQHSMFNIPLLLGGWLYGALLAIILKWPKIKSH